MKSKYKICYGIWGRMNGLIYSSCSLQFPRNEAQRKQIEIIIKQLTDNKTEKRVLYTKRFGHFMTNRGTEKLKIVDFILPYHESEKIINQIKNII
jgi:hypothetical protein